MKENRQLRWAMPGTGVIANEMAQALQAMDRTLDAVGNRTYGKAVSFGSKYGGKQVCADYHQMFTDLDIDAICLTPPPPPTTPTWPIWSRPSPRASMCCARSPSP